MDNVERALEAAVEDAAGRCRAADRNAASVYAVVAPGQPARYFDSWADAEPAVSGKSGVRFKRFPDRAAAEAWVGGVDRTVPPADIAGPNDPPAAELANRVVHLYVDGSYRKAEKNGPRYAGYGWAAIAGGGRVLAEGCGRLAAAPSRNIDGELAAALAAMRWWDANRAEWPRAVIWHDYLGIREWAAGTWAGRSLVARTYIAAVVAEGFGERVGRSLFFRHVRGHTGDQWNEYVDGLAGRGACRRRITANVPF